MKEKQNIIKPIFIIGAPRSGTSFLYKTLSKHPDICTITSPDNQKLRYIIEEIASLSPQITYSLSKVLNVELREAEGSSVWTIRLVDDCDVLTEEDSSFLRDYIIKRTIRSNINFFNAKRFLAKDPPLSFKIRYLNKIFPDSKFINIFRDGRAVVNSTMKNWKIKAKYMRWWGAKPKNWRSILKSKNLLEICARQWLETLKYIDENKHIIPDYRFFEIKYENLIQDFDEVIKKIIIFCELENIPIDKLMYRKPKNMNWKWKIDLNQEQKHNLIKNDEFRKMLEVKGFCEVNC